MPNALPTGLHASRPRIFVGGSEQPTLSGGLLSMMIGEHLSGLYRCEIKFGNWGPVNNNIDFLYFDRQLLDFGKDLQIKLDDELLLREKSQGWRPISLRRSPQPSWCLLKISSKTCG